MSTVMPSIDKQPVPEDETRRAHETYVITELNDLADILAFGVEFYWQDSNVPCTDGEGRVGLPRSFAGEAEAVDVRDGVAHELCAHVYDQIKSPSYVANIRSWEQRTKNPQEQQLRHAYTGHLTDIVGNIWKAELSPRLGEDQVDVYGRILYPTSDFRGSPKTMQLFDKWLRDAMVPNEPCVVDDDVQAIHDELIDEIRLTTNRRIVGDDERFTIWTELVWPKLAPLVKHDLAQPKKLQKALAADEILHGQACSGLHETAIVTPGKAGGHSHSSEPSLADTIKQAQTEKQTGGSRGAGQRAEREALTGYSAEARQAFYGILQRQAGVLDALDAVYRKFLSQEVTRKPRYQAGADGSELAAGALALGYTESLAGVPNPKVWQERTWREKIRPGHGPFDMWVVTDATGSMEAIGANTLASEATALLATAFERYNTAVEEIIGEDNASLLSRLSVVSFAGLPTIERPLAAFSSEKEHLDAFYHVQQAAGGNTLINTALKAIRESHEETAEPRRRVVVVITDGQDSDKPKTKLEAQELEKLGYEVQVWNVSGSISGLPNEEAVGTPAELPRRMLAIAETLVPTDKDGA